MVDFRDREEVKRWLDAIEPAERRRDVAVALAARAALRVLPLLGRELTEGKRKRGDILSYLVLPCLRATALPWTASKYPAHANELRVEAIQATDAAIVAAAAAAVAKVGVAASAANAAVYAAETVNAAADSATYTAAAAVEAGSYSAFVADTVAYDAYDADTAVIDSGRSGVALSEMPLWPKSAPGWATEGWRSLKSALLTANEGWEVWTDWYEARLAGDAAHPPNEALEVARATIPDEIWRQGPAAVNVEIKRLIDEHEKGEQVVDDANADVVTIDDQDREQADFAPILATRAALRVLPLLVNDRDRLGDAAKSKFVLAIFRALAVAWARTQYPSVVERQWSVAAARDVSTYSPGSGPAARSVGSAATEAAFASGSAEPRVAVSRASRAVIQVKEAVRAAARDDASEVIIEHANSGDISDIVPGVRPDQIAQIELWPGRDPPPFIGEQWEALKEGLRFANEGWDVWIDWYEARLDGRLRSQEVELAYVQFIRNVLPTSSAWEANSEIKRLIDLYTPPPEAMPGTPYPRIESIPEQERTGTRFGIDAQGRIDVVRIPPSTDELQRLHYDEMRHKALALAALGQMLGDVALPTNRILEALPEHMEDASVDKLWSRANTLRRRHNAHVRSIENDLGPDPARLHALVAENLGDFVDGFNVYVLGDPRALELDTARLGPQDREAVRKVAALAAPIARAANEPQSPTTPAAQEALAEQVDAAIDAPDDINGDQAADLARKTTGNFVGELLRRAYAPIAKCGDLIKKEGGFAQHEFRAGFYRAAGAGAFAGLPVAAYAYWPEISAFVVRNADALKAFVSAAFHNPKLVEIIDLIVQATRHFG
ncbi:MAG: hypothetical protein ACLPSW_17410 [Roseiarcus sp.]